MTKAINRRTVLAGTTAAILSAPFVNRALAANIPVSLGTMRLVSSAPFFLGMDRGFFAEQGLEPTMQYFDAAQPVAVAAAAGSLDAGCAAFSVGLFNVAGPGNVRVVAGASREVAGYPLVGYLATTKAWEAGVKTPKDLLGKKIGVSQLGASYHYIMSLLAKKYKFEEKKLEMVQLNSMSNIAAGIKAARVDGGLLPLTFVRPLVDSGEAKLLGWVGDETPWQLGSIFLSKKFNDNEDQARRFLAGYRKACNVFYDELLSKRKNGAAPVDAATRPYLEVLSKYTKLAPEAIATDLPFIDRDGKVDFADVGNQVQWGQENGFVEKTFTADNVVEKKYGFMA